MRYRFTIKGDNSILMHCGFRGLDSELPDAKEKANIAKRRTNTRTSEEEKRLRELECRLSLWLDEDDNITIPDRVFRACIESAARKRKEGPSVREGLTVEATTFIWDTERYGTTIDEVGKTAQFTTPVAVKNNRINRTRAKFDDWGATFVTDIDDDVVERESLVRWVKEGGRRMGLGDWRPQKSGRFGRYTITDVEVQQDGKWTSVVNDFTAIIAT